MRRKATLEIIGPIPTFFSLCKNCVAIMRLCKFSDIPDQLNDYPEEVRNAYFKISQLATNVSRDLSDIVELRVIDAASALGLWKTLRYRIRKTPAFIINKKKAFEEIPSYEALRNELTRIGMT